MGSCGCFVPVSGKNYAEKEFAVVRNALQSIGYVENAVTNGFTLSRTRHADEKGEVPWQGVQVTLQKGGIKTEFSVGFTENANCTCEGSLRFPPCAIVMLVDRNYSFHEPTKKLIDEAKGAIEKGTKRAVIVGSKREENDAGAPPGSAAA